MIKKIFDDLKSFDLKLTNNINNFSKNYLPIEIPLLASKIPIFLKTIFYILLLIIPFLILKILYPYNKLISAIIILISLIITFCLGGIFLGLFQIQYSF